MLFRNKDLFRFYWNFIKQEKKSCALLILMPSLWCTAETYAPYLIKLLLDRLNHEQNDVTFLLTQFSFIYIVLMAIIEGSLRVSSYLCIKLIPKIKERIREKILQYIQTYPLYFFQTHLNGDILTAIKNLADSFEQAVVSFVYGLYSITLTFFVSLLLIGYINKFFACLFTVWYLGMNVITFLFYKQTIHTSEIAASSETKLFGFMSDLIRNSLLFKTFNSSKIDQSLLADYQNKTTTTLKEAEWVTFKADSLRGFLSFVFLSILFIFLVQNWQKGLISIGEFAFITTICFYIRRSTWMATIQLLTFLKYVGIAKNSFSLLFKHNILSIPIEKNPMKNIQGEIRFKEVTFGYENDKRIFNNLSLHIPAGQKVGLIGPSGAGKTTLIHLLLKILTPETGKIYLDHYSIQDETQADIIKHVAYTSQLAPLFHRTIFDNIHYGNINASYEEVLQASKACLCESFISECLEGYHTIIGEDGVKLSGGQRQRLALARLFLKESSILIFDEATSALDPDTERRVLESFLRQDKTIIIISHNPSILHKLDRIVILENGKIIKDCPPTEIENYGK